MRLINEEEYCRLSDLAMVNGMEFEQLRHMMGIRSIPEMPRSRLPEARRIVRAWGAGQCAAEDADAARREQRGDR